MGLGYETLSALNPRLVYGNITGYGRTGPAASWPGFDQVAQGYAGIMSLTGMPDAGPTRVGIAIGDMTAGMWTAMGVLAALLSRQQTGRGPARQFAAVRTGRHAGRAGPALFERGRNS